MHDTNWVMISSFIGFMGYLFLVDFQEGIVQPWRFVVGFTLISCAFIIGRGTTMSMYAKLFGGQSTGNYMTILLCVSAFSRIVGPIWAVYCLLNGPYLIFGISAGLFILSLVLQVIFNNSLTPHWSYYVERSR